MGPVLIDRHRYQVRTVADAQLDDLGDCRTVSFGGGALVQVRYGAQAVQTTYVSYAGTVTKYQDAWIERVNRESWSAVLQTPSGLILVSARGTAKVPVADITEVRLVTAAGTVLIRTADAWYLVQHEPKDETEVLSFMKRTGMTYAVGYADRNLSNAFLTGSEDETGLPPIPQLFVFGKDGRLVERLIGYNESHGLAALDRIVAEQLSQ